VENLANRNIILTGSAGYLGSRVEKMLINSGFIVMALDKQDPDNPTDLSNRDSVRKLQLPDSYQLVHLAFPLPGKIGRKQFESTIFSINENLTSLLSPSRTLFISSTAVYSLESESEVIPKPWEVYGKLKLETEEALASNFGNLTIFRPGTLIETSRKSTMMSFLKQLLNSKISLVPGSGNLTHPFTNTQDLIDAIGNWAQHSDAPCGIFNLTACDPISFTEMQKILNKTSRVAVIQLPLWLLRKIGSDKYPLFGISKWHFRALTYNLTLSSRNVYNQNFMSYSSMLKKI
jgi:nucleoside-diphosphate-sugar epimerase